ncbi:MAG: WYL domain-containing protein [Gemmatimonadota bacterium]|nr:WYL domain-containing protein [Gemmatimonadota bacterium]
MADLAAAQVERLISLVAWMSQGDRETAITYAAAARRLGVGVDVVRKDLDVLINLTEGMKPWLTSLQVAFTADGFMLGSLGAFRRPLRLTGDEALALILGLLQARDGDQLARRLGGMLGKAPQPREVDRVWAIGPTPGEAVAQVLALARRGRDECRRLELTYCGSAAEATSRVVHPYQVVQSSGHWYIIAWCEAAAAERKFRAERVLTARLLPDSFDPKANLPLVRGAQDLRPSQAELTAVVAFSRKISRWVRERYPAGEERADGRYVVRFAVADPRWLAREVLQYGAEAEVLEPEAVRAQLREMLA